MGIKIGLRGKLLFAICTIIFVSLTFSISIITIQAFKASKQEALEKTIAMTRNFGTQIQLEMDRAMDSARTIVEFEKKRFVVKGGMGNYLGFIGETKYNKPMKKTKLLSKNQGICCL